MSSKMHYIFSATIGTDKVFGRTNQVNNRRLNITRHQCGTTKQKEKAVHFIRAAGTRASSRNVICFSAGYVNFGMMRMYGRRLNRSREAKFSSNMVSQIGSARIRIIPALNREEIKKKKKILSLDGSLVFLYVGPFSQSSFRQLHRENH